MDAYAVTLRGAANWRPLVDAFERAGCATMRRDSELVVLIPLDAEHEDGDVDQMHDELLFFLRAWQATDPRSRDVLVVDERPAFINDRVFERLRVGG